MPRFQGGCHCGAVRYETTGEPFHRTLCHCTDCRRVSGAPLVAWFSVAEQDFRWTAAAPRAYRSSEGVTRFHCEACGTPLVYARAGTGEVDVTTASLDQPEAVPPADQTFARSRIGWLAHLDKLPAHATTRPKA